MAAKPETAPAAAPAAPAPEPAQGKGLIATLLPILAAVVLAPAASWAVVEFVLLPRLQKQLSGQIAAPVATAQAEKGAAGEGKGENGAPDASYEFTNVVVNLAGTMGTRYLKTSFLVTGADPQIKSLFEEQKPKLTDVTLNVLSSLTLADLEQPGAKNVLREKLVTAYNQALGHKVADQVYFSDFVVQ